METKSMSDKPATKPTIETITLKQLCTELKIPPREARERLYRPGLLGFALEQDGRQIVSVLDAALAGVARGHPIAAVIEDATGEQGF
jgi:hypothetical protein